MLGYQFSTSSSALGDGCPCPRRYATDSWSETSQKIYWLALSFRWLYRLRITPSVEVGSLYTTCLARSLRLVTFDLCEIHETLVQWLIKLYYLLKNERFWLGLVFLYMPEKRYMVISVSSLFSILSKINRCLHVTLVLGTLKQRGSRSMVL